MSYTGSHIIEEMLKKAQEAQDKGDQVTADHWLKRAEEVEAKLKGGGDAR